MKIETVKHERKCRNCHSHKVDIYCNDSGMKKYFCACHGCSHHSENSFTKKGALKKWGR